MFDECIIFCNVWNEWVEGVYLELDICFGYVWLEIICNVLDLCVCLCYIMLIGYDVYLYGVQFLLLNFVCVYKQVGLVVKILLLEGGLLVKDYVEVVELIELFDFVIWCDDVLCLLCGLCYEYVEVVVCNIMVFGSVLFLLQEMGYSFVVLVYEMCLVFVQMDLLCQIVDLVMVGVLVVFFVCIVCE